MNRRKLEEERKSFQSETINKLRNLAESYWQNRNSDENESGEIEKMLLECVKRRFIIWKYQKDVDLLFIRFALEDSIISGGDPSKGVIYNYDGKDNLVSVEILDFYGVFIEADK